MMEVRPLGDGFVARDGRPLIDEVVAKGWDCHIESLSECEYIIIFYKDGEQERRFWVGSKSRRAEVQMIEVE